MTLPIERSRPRRPVTWLTLVGIVLLPVIIGGILIAALYNPTERLENISAAIVNEDEPVTIGDQLVPLGRQLTAGLVEGSDELDSNLTWTISNADDAADGLAEGTYNAVITIPADFSAAATSTQPGGTPEKAVIDVTTPPDSLIVDDAITAQVAQAAASLMGDELSSLYLENVLLGFTTLGDQLGDAADGAGELADGTSEAAGGTVSLADGVAQLSGGADQLAGGAGGIASGVGELAGGARELAAGADGIAGGAAEIAEGAGQLAAGTAAAADGLDTWAGGARDIAAGGGELAGGLTLMADEVSQLPDVPVEVVDAAGALAADSEQIRTAVTDAAAELAALSADCLAQGGSAELCATLTDISARVDDALPTVTATLGDADTIAAGVADLAEFEPRLVAALREAAGGASALAGGMDELADGAADAAGGLDELSGGMSSLASGADELAGGTSTWASGARTWAAGADQAASGASTWAGGASTWATGATDAAAGADDLADGLGLIADGTGELAAGLQTATDEIPSYSDAEAAELAGVVADPVSAQGVGSELFGASAVPLLTTLALWFGGLGSFVALQAVTRRSLAARASSPVLALRALAPAAGLGAVQGLLVAGVVQLAASYDPGAWTVFALVCVVAGVAFAAVNQALVAVFGGAGRWVSAMIGVLAVATGVVSTVPGALSAVAALVPTSPAYNGMVAALTSADGVAAGLVGLTVWALLALAATVVAVTRRRTVTARSLLAV
ncbi:YhgE/Pip family protein [Microbacterium sp. Marseille-Q6648]|uniref:YhgE/Pip domain-containing protein n=1 Tax=Microbacterium sp. Marseille-Q6648 TaxID=2937991 RepID=UPI00203E48BF|nr:YhgE/Pip family protein [Microbacterium sp. Marseille-Q6648]